MPILIAYSGKERISIYEYSNEDVKCPEGHSLFAKRGQKNQWHFAHKKKEDEDSCSCSKEKGEWHCWHQNRINKNNIEIFFEKRKHIADCVNEDGLVIEFQKSTIPKETIEERERYYKNMIWVFCMDFHDFEKVKEYKNLVHIKIIKGSKYFLEATKETYLDCSHKRTMMKVLGKIKNDLVVQLLELDDFDNKFLKNIILPNADKRITGIFSDYEKATEEEIKSKLKQWKVKN